MGIEAKSGIDYALRQYIMAALSIPAVGRIKYLVDVDSSTAKYRTRLHENGVSYRDMYTTLANAYAAVEAYANDVICVMPGAYTLTEELDWAKSQTHLIGMGGPNQRMSPAAGTNGMVRFYCSEAYGSDASMIKVSGDYVQFHNFQLRNTVSDVNNLSDLELSGKNFYAKGLHCRGGGGANQVNGVRGIPLWIESSAGSASNAHTFVDCWFGDPHGTARTAGPSAMYAIGGSGQGTCLEFYNCKFLSTSETAAVPAIQLGAAAGTGYCIDRYMLLDGCFFYNFSLNLGNILNDVILDNQNTTHTIILKNSVHYGWTHWTSAPTYTFTNQPASDHFGGLLVSAADA